MIAIDLFNCATDAVSGVAFFLFLQNYFLSKHGFLRGYYLGLTGKLSEPSSSLGSMKRRSSADNDKTKPRTVESAKVKSTINNPSSVPSSGSAFSLNAASSAATSSKESLEYKSRITHSYESSSNGVPSTTSNTDIGTNEDLDSNTKKRELEEPNEEPRPAEGEVSPSVSRSFSFEMDESGSQSSFIFNLFKS